MMEGMASRLLGLAVTALCASWALFASLVWFRQMVRRAHPDACEIFIEAVLFLVVSLAGVAYFSIDFSRYLLRLSGFHAASRQS
jgi:hypothetical protein